MRKVLDFRILTLIPICFFYLNCLWENNQLLLQIRTYDTTGCRHFHDLVSAMRALFLSISNIGIITIDSL